MTSLVSGLVLPRRPLSPLLKLGTSRGGPWPWWGLEAWGGHLGHGHGQLPAWRAAQVGAGTCGNHSRGEDGKHQGATKNRNPLSNPYRCHACHQQLYGNQPLALGRHSMPGAR